MSAGGASTYRVSSAAVSQGQTEFPRLPWVHAELKPQSFISTTGQTQRPDPGVTRRHFDRHQYGAASRPRGLLPGQRGVVGVGGRGRGGRGEGGGRTWGRLRSSGALRHSTVTVDDFAFHRRFSFKPLLVLLHNNFVSHSPKETHISPYLSTFTQSRKQDKSIQFHFSSSFGYYVQELSKCVITNTPTRPSPSNPPALRMRGDDALAQCNTHAEGDFLWRGANSYERQYSFRLQFSTLLE